MLPQRSRRVGFKRCTFVVVDTETIASWLRKVPPEVEVALSAGSLEERCDSLAKLIEDRIFDPPPPEGDLCSQITYVMERQLRDAERQNENLRELHAKILGIPLDQLDAHLEEEDRKERERIAALKASQPERPKKARKVIKKNEAGTPERVLSDRQKELLSHLIVKDNVATYPGTERVPDWDVLKDAMSLIGSKWTTKKGFTFKKGVDAEEAIKEAIGSVSVTDARAAGFFPTPPELAKDLVQPLRLKAGARVLEPSAGHGALADAVLNRFPEVTVQCVELLRENVDFLEENGHTVFRGDFLTIIADDLFGGFDAVVMNPPFNKRADVIHVLHALKFVRKGGTVAAIMSAGSLADLRKKLPKGVEMKSKRNPEGSFKSAGTEVATVSVWIKLRAT